MTRRPSHAFTLLELLVVISIIVMLIAILLPALMGVRRGARQQENGTRMKSVLDAMKVFANGNRGYFPGLTSAGVVVAAGSAPLNGNTGAYMQARVGIMLGSALVEPKAFINPIDPEVEPYKGSGAGTFNSTTGVQTGGTTVINKNCSYAMLLLAGGGSKREQAWTDTVNPKSPLMCDRNNGANNSGSVSSVWTEISKGTWNGSVGWGDLHVSFEQTHTLKTQYPAAKTTNNSDNLFNFGDGDAGDGGGEDAAMIYHDISSGWNQKP